MSKLCKVCTPSKNLADDLVMAPKDLQLLLMVAAVYGELG